MWVSVTILWGGGGTVSRANHRLGRVFVAKTCSLPLPLAGKNWSEWNAVWGKGFSIRAVRLVQRRLPFPLKKAGWHGTLSVEWVFPSEHEPQKMKQLTNNVTGIFQSFRLERKKRNMSKDLHLFQKVSSVISFTVKIFQPKILAFLLTNGSLPWSYGHYRAFASQAKLTRGRTHRICTGYHDQTSANNHTSNNFSGGPLLIQHDTNNLERTYGNTP